MNTRKVLELHRPHQLRFVISIHVTITLDGKFSALSYFLITASAFMAKIMLKKSNEFHQGSDHLNRIGCKQSKWFHWIEKLWFENVANFSTDVHYKSSGSKQPSWAQIVDRFASNHKEHFVTIKTFSQNAESGLTKVSQKRRMWNSFDSIKHLIHFISTIETEFYSAETI